MLVRRVEPYAAGQGSSEKSWIIEETLELGIKIGARACLKHQFGTVEQFLSTAAIGGENGNTESDALHRDLGQVVLPQHGDDGEINGGENVAQLGVCVTCIKSDCSETMGHALDTLIGAQIGDLDSESKSELASQSLRHLLESIKKKVKSLIAPHVTQVGKVERRAGSVNCRAGSAPYPAVCVAGSSHALCPSPLFGEARTDIERLHFGRVDAKTDGQLRDTPGDGQNVIGVSIQGRDE